MLLKVFELDFVIILIVILIFIILVIILIITKISSFFPFPFPFPQIKLNHLHMQGHRLILQQFHQSILFQLVIYDTVHWRCILCNFAQLFMMLSLLQTLVHFRLALLLITITMDIIITIITMTITTTDRSPNMFIVISFFYTISFIITAWDDVVLLL